MNEYFFQLDKIGNQKCNSTIFLFDFSPSKYRYDIALDLNTFGVKHIMSFAKQCIRLKVLVHVSTGHYYLMSIINSRSGTILWLDQNSIISHASIISHVLHLLQHNCHALISAYVCGEKSGLILESPYLLGDSLNGVAGLDINAEKKLVTEKLGELQEKGATEHEIKVAMKDLGITRFVKIYIIVYFKLPYV